MKIVQTQSLIVCRPPGSAAPKWFKFDDGEVSEAKLDDEEVCIHAYKYTHQVCSILSIIYSFRSLSRSVLEGSLQERFMTTS